MQSDETVEIVTGIIAMLEQDSMFASSIAAFGGTDFVDIREWASGDSCRDIDWPRTLATNKMHLRLREQERSIPVCIALDVSKSMLMSGDVSKRHVALETIDVLVRAALRKSCVVTIVLFSNGIEWVRRSIADQRAYERARSEIAVFEPREHASTDIKGMLQYLSWELRLPTLVFLISDFLSPFEWEEDFETLLNRNDVVPVILEDPRDSRGPAGFAYCQGVESHNVRLAFAAGSNMLADADLFFEQLRHEGRSVWTRMQTSDSSNSRSEKLAEMFRMFEEQISTRIALRR
ncbi:MAG: DUF58 domain-containing protein [bacterium]|nr:DUF58 domain-containing protein [bacterium]